MFTITYNYIHNINTDNFNIIIIKYHYKIKRNILCFKINRNITRVNQLVESIRNTDSEDVR